MIEAIEKQGWRAPALIIPKRVELPLFSEARRRAEDRDRRAAANPASYAIGSLGNRSHSIKNENLPSRVCDQGNPPEPERAWRFMGCEIYKGLNSLGNEEQTADLSAASTAGFRTVEANEARFRFQNSPAWSTMDHPAEQLFTLM
tara:strand:- start:4692 stop:5126 length:435 start_codon:yes stop_codon:yes gene_type:complete